MIIMVLHIFMNVFFVCFRIKLWENVTHVGVTIRDLQFDDSGRYECGDDLLKLRVIDKGKSFIS